MTKSPVIVAIDTQDVEAAKAMAQNIAPEVAMIKLGLEFFMAHGSYGVRDVTNHGKIPFFLDVKIHDIPNTVAGAVHSVAPLQPSLLTVHAQGGIEMMRMAKMTADDTANEWGFEPPKLLAVTMLTHLEQSHLDDLHIKQTVADQVKRLAEMAIQAGVTGCVCSPQEIDILRAEFGKKLTLVTPGIRPEGTSAHDQKRVMTPKEALDRGTDYLVIGRPITMSEDPVAAAKAINESL